MSAAVDLQTELSKWEECLRQTYGVDVYLVDSRCLDQVVFPESTIVVCADETQPQEVVQLVLNHKLCHIVQMCSIEFEQELHSAAKLIANARGVMSEPEKYFFNQEQYTRLFQQKYSSLDLKHTILEKIKKVIISHQGSQSLAMDILSIADELFTNSIYHSAGIEKGERSRELTQGLFSEIFVDCDKDRIAIGCIDPFGLLDPERLLQRIHHCYISDIAESINMGEGGAGIGSYMIHNMSTSYYVVVDENKQTLINIILPLTMSNRKRRKQPKNLHKIFLKEKNSEQF